MACGCVVCPQVAKGAESQPAEMESYLLHTLERDALVWTEGLADWLPIGDLPPLHDLPPMPRAVATEAAPGNSSPSGSPSGQGGSPASDSFSRGRAPPPVDVGGDAGASP